MEAGEPADEPEPEEAVEGDHQRRGLGADGGPDVRRRLPGPPAPGELGQPSPADDLDRDAEGRGGGDEEQEEAVVAGLGCLFCVIGKTSDECFFCFFSLSLSPPLSTK